MPGYDLLSLFALLITLACGLSILIFQGITGVPPLSSNSLETADVVALLVQARLDRQAIVYELGSGWGSLVIALARAFPKAQIRGIEMSPVPYWVSRIRTRKMPNVLLRRGQFLQLRSDGCAGCHVLFDDQADAKARGFPRSRTQIGYSGGVPFILVSRQTGCRFPGKLRGPGRNSLVLLARRSSIDPLEHSPQRIGGQGNRNIRIHNRWESLSVGQRPFEFCGRLYGSISFFG